MVNGEWEMKEGMGLGLVVVGRGVEVGGEEGFEGEVLLGGREVDGQDPYMRLLVEKGITNMPVLLVNNSFMDFAQAVSFLRSK